MVLLGQSLSFASDEEGTAVAAIMPEVDVRTGEFKASHTIRDLLGETAASKYERIIPPDEAIEWEIYVAENYHSDRPAGILIYISPTQKGDIPPQWKSLLAEQNLIWIGANKSGNRVQVQRRMAYALTAPAVINKSYQVDTERIYLSGFSGGGRVASMVAVEFPHIFKGAIFNCGAEYWGDDEPGMLGLIKTNRYVFLTGTYDDALEQTKKAYRGFQSAGVEHSKLMIIRNMSHSNPKRRDFKKAIEYLDQNDAD